MTRTFIALEQDESLQRHLGETIRRMAPALPHLKWIDPASIHLTLAFLGELTDEQLAKAVESSDGAARQAAPFGYRLAQLGTFGAPRQPRVVWIGVDEPTGELTRLQRLLTRELEQRGFAGETRPFSPHLTLARVKEPFSAAELQTLQHFLADQRLNAPSPYYRTQRVSVMKSELARAGAVYTRLYDSLLGERPV